MLGAYLGMPPSDVRFSYGAYGKPELAPDCNTSRIEFNLSHSRGLAAYAFVPRRKVGIDLEHMHTVAELEQVAAQRFSSRERLFLETLAPAQRQRWCYVLWTRKEAYLKGQGLGLSFPLDQFDVVDIPLYRDSQTLTAGAGSAWSLYDLCLLQDNAAALAVEGQKHHLRFWHWSLARPKRHRNALKSGSSHSDASDH